MQSMGIHLDATELVKAVEPHRRDSRLILRNINLSVQPGEFVAIVGQSGAGKTTLLQVLSGRQTSFGNVHLNGYPLAEVNTQYSGIVGYVPDYATLHPILTVEQGLRYAARLRLAPTATIDERIRQVLGEVELPTRLLKQPLGTLSRGEAKRVNIAAELLTDPYLFFLDEPTGSLDPYLEKKMMLTLRHMADTGRTIVLVTHATANITICDYVAFMAGSYLTYFGPPHEALAFFDVDEFADIYERINGQGPYWNREFCSPWSPHYQKLIVGRQLAEARPDDFPPHAALDVDTVRQFTTLVRRMFRMTLRDRVALIVLLLVMPTMGLAMVMLSGPYDIIGLPEIPARKNYVAWRKAEVQLIMMAIAALILGLFAATHEVVKERRIFVHESKVILRTLPYILSKMAVLSFFAALQVGLFLGVLALRIHLPTEGTFLPGLVEWFITLFLGTVAALSLGLCISSIANSTNTATYVAIVIIFLQIVFSGAIFQLNNAGELVSNLTLSRWILDGLGTTNNMETLGVKTQICTERDCMLMPTGTGAMGVPYGANFDHLTTVWLVLLLFSLLFLATTYYFVHMTAKSET